MGEQDNLRIARETWDAWNAHDVEGAVKLQDEKITWESDTLPSPIVGREAFAQVMKMCLKGFPDLRFNIDKNLRKRRPRRVAVHGDRNPRRRLRRNCADEPTWRDSWLHDHGVSQREGDQSLGLLGQW